MAPDRLTRLAEITAHRAQELSQMRAEIALRLREKGWKQKDIATLFGVSPERIKQLCTKAFQNRKRIVSENDGMLPMWCGPVYWGPK